MTILNKSQTNISKKAGRPMGSIELANSGVSLDILFPEIFIRKQYDNFINYILKASRFARFFVL